MRAAARGEPMGTCCRNMRCAGARHLLIWIASRAAMQGLASLWLSQSLDHPEGLDYKGYLYWLEQAAQHGDGVGECTCPADALALSAHGQLPPAATVAATMYFEGECVPMDERRGAQVLQAAVDAQCDSIPGTCAIYAVASAARTTPHRGVVRAAYEVLAQCYRDGRGVPKDPERMAALYERRADASPSRPSCAPILGLSGRAHALRPAPPPPQSRLSWHDATSWARASTWTCAARRRCMREARRWDTRKARSRWRARGGGVGWESDGDLAGAVMNSDV